MSQTKRFPLVATLFALALAACIRRPVSTEKTTTKISFDTVVPQPAIDKIDLLLMVDNSASMADKQRILADAVPDLVRGLVQPKCIDVRTRQPTGVLSDPTKPDSEVCPAGSEPAFPPITDMHIGVLSSSLGGQGSSSCKGTLRKNEDDHGHLLARGESGDVAAAGDLHFLAWYPDVARNQDKDRHPDPPVPKTKTVDELGAAFRELVVGVGQDGCGLEAQLESVYRFLVQPDPWKAIAQSNGVASYGPKTETDGELLRQRAAFLRPDSLVAVIMLTDEDDSWPDPLAFRGQGWRFLERRPLPRATMACAKDPNDAACMSCSVPDNGDPTCTTRLEYSTEEDELNVRFHHMKGRFGVDPQFPISRYVDGLTKQRVPSREAEHDENGNYVPRAGCTNPLFAARLPTSADEELCALPRGPRSPSLVYFALIGGVPGKLLSEEADGTQKLDWTKILGRDPSRWDESGIDPHMLQSSSARRDLPPPTSSTDADPVHGREWTTQGKDLQYACTFDLYERGPDGRPTPLRRPCDENDRKNGVCDCDGTKDAPLCAADDLDVQVKGKAYPTRRELMVAKELDVQGIVASLCPKQLTAPEDDDYGYRPAVRAITTRLERSLVGSCLPRALERQDEAGNVPCSVLAILPDPGPDTECARFGLKAPKPQLLDQVRAKLRSERDDAVSHPICEIPQLAVAPGETCRNTSDSIAFCYTEAPLLTHCPQALSFTKASEQLTFARFTMQCIQQTSEN